MAWGHVCGFLNGEDDPLLLLCRTGKTTCIAGQRRAALWRVRQSHCDLFSETCSMKVFSSSMLLWAPLPLL